jgi:hypothetical protein
LAFTFLVPLESNPTEVPVTLSVEVTFLAPEYVQVTPLSPRITSPTYELADAFKFVNDSDPCAKVNLKSQLRLIKFFHDLKNLIINNLQAKITPFFLVMQ